MFFFVIFCLIVSPESSIFRRKKWYWICVLGYSCFQFSTFFIRGSWSIVTFPNFALSGTYDSWLFACVESIVCCSFLENFFLQKHYYLSISVNVASFPAHSTHSTITHKISETNSSFHMKQRTKGKSLISVFQDFSSSINKTFILARRLGTRLSFYEFRHFSDVSYYPKILSLRSFWQLVRQLIYTMSISNNRTLFHLKWKENLVKYRKVSKYFETDCR